MANLEYVEESIELDGKTLSEAIEELTYIQNDYPINATLDITTEYEYGDERAVVNICYRRPYTSEELTLIKEREVEQERRRAEMVKDSLIVDHACDCLAKNCEITINQEALVVEGCKDFYCELNTS